MSNSYDAAFAADNLIELLIKHQPDLIKSNQDGPSETSGRELGEFIAGLRSRLIDMYNLTPRG